MKSLLLGLAATLCLTAQAATSSSSIGAPIFALTDLAPGDGISPVFRPFRFGDDLSFFTEDFRFLGALQPEVVQTTGRASVTTKLGATGALMEFAGRTSGPDSSYGVYSTYASPIFYLTPNTLLTLTFPYKLAYDGRDGFASAAINLDSKFVASRNPLTGDSALELRAARDDALDSTAGTPSVGQRISQFVLTFRNSTAQAGAVGYFYGLFASGRSAAVGCMRSLKR
jgi:hypothetical protein